MGLMEHHHQPSDLLPSLVQAFEGLPKDLRPLVDSREFGMGF